jgi:hypothetical protein
MAISSLCTLRATAQDSLDQVKKFIEINDVYNTGSIYVDVVVKSHSSYGNSDSLGKEFQFYLVAGGAYMKCGALEEVINDSLVLLL